MNRTVEDFADDLFDVLVSAPEGCDPALGRMWAYAEERLAKGGLSPAFRRVLQCVKEAHEMVAEADRQEGSSK